MLRPLLPLALLAALAGCGERWSASDAKSASDAARSELMLENLCADGMPCKPAQVRALERAAFCANASMLARHGEYVPAGGPKCLP